MRQTTQHRHRASSHLICTQSAFATSAMISGAMSVMGVFFGKHVSQWKQSMKYFTTVSQQMSTAIRHVVKDSIVFQRKRKDVISTFPVLQGSAPLLRRGGKLYHLSCLPPSSPASCEMFLPKIIEIQLGILDSDLRTPGIIAIGQCHPSSLDYHINNIKQTAANVNVNIHVHVYSTQC